MNTAPPHLTARGIASGTTTIVAPPAAVDRSDSPESATVGRRPKVSVVVCTYNGAAYVAAQLESILSQTLVPDEVIVSDDVSSDATLDVVRRVTTGRNRNVRILQNATNLRVNGNFERAIGHATGDIIFTSDQDDFWFPDRVARMVAALRSEDRISAAYCDAVVTDGSLVPSGETLFSSRSHFHIARRRTAPEVLTGVEVRGCTLAFKSHLKPLILPLPDDRYWGWDYWIVLLASAVGEVQPVAGPLMYYRRHGDNRSPLAHGLFGDLQSGLSASSVSADAYARDTGRWVVARDRLQHVLAARALPTDQHARAEAFLRHVEQRLALAVVRERIRHKARLRRLPGVAVPLLRGDYHRYKRGLKTAVKDLLAP